MQKTKDGCRWTIRLSNKDYAQKEVIRMFEYLLATGEYATESDIFREALKAFIGKRQSRIKLQTGTIEYRNVPALQLIMFWNECRPCWMQPRVKVVL